MTKSLKTSLKAITIASLSAFVFMLAPGVALADSDNVDITRCGDDVTFVVDVVNAPNGSRTISIGGTPGTAFHTEVYTADPHTIVLDYDTMLSSCNVEGGCYLFVSENLAGWSPPDWQWIQDQENPTESAYFDTCALSALDDEDVGDLIDGLQNSLVTQFTTNLPDILSFIAGLVFLIIGIKAIRRAIRKYY